MKTKLLVLVSLLVVVFAIAVWLGWGDFFKLNGRNFSAQINQTQNPSTLNFYVATNGSDAAGDGTIGNPFLTLEKARDAIRAQRGVSATVWIRGGTYQLTQSFTLTNQDSGTANAPITYQNYNNEEVHIIGGKKITGFTPSARANIFQVDLKAQGITDFGDLSKGSALQLFFNNKPMTLARYPNAEYPNNTGWLSLGDGPINNSFVYKDDRPSGWANFNDIWVNGMYNGYRWAAFYLKVTDINKNTKVVTTATTPQYGIDGAGIYYWTNVLEELDSPGEYYLDRTTGILYFWPSNNNIVGEAYVSLLEDPLITMNNVNYLTIRGLTLEKTRGQSINGDTCDHVLIDQCVVRNIGATKNSNYETSYAISFTASRNCGVTASTLYYLADGAISLTGIGKTIGTTFYPGLQDRITLTNSKNFVLNSTIHDYGMWNLTFRTGILIAGVGNRVAHNLIYNAPHGSLDISGNDNVVEFNEIHHVCLITSDAGAMGEGREWTMRGNIYRYNFIHDIVEHTNRPIGIYGIGLDDGFSGTQMYGNIFYNVSNAILINSGRDNLVANNIVVDSDNASFMLTNRLYALLGDNPPYPSNFASLSHVPYQNELWSTRYPELKDIIKQVDGVYVNQPNRPWGNKFLTNIHYNTLGKEWLSTYQFTAAAPIPTSCEFRNNWVNGDPLFVNYANKNFQLAANSPVWALGFQRIPIEEIGPHSNAVGVAMTFDNLPIMDWGTHNLKSNFKNGLILYFPLDDSGQDTVLDSSGNNNNGAIVLHYNGTVTWLGENSGKRGNSVGIDGTGYISVKSDSSLATQGARTVSFWLKTTDTGFGIIGFHGVNNNTGLSVENSKPILRLGGYNYRYWGNVSPYLDGNWHHWCLVITGVGQNDIANSVLKIDNTVISANIPAMELPITTWTTHIIGYLVSLTTVSMDEIMIWNRVLTNAEITDLYNLNIFESGAPTIESNIILTKSADKTQASSGEEITYTITYQNSGAGNALDVVIIDPLPTGATYVAGSASNGGVLSGTTLTWNIGAVGVGISGSVSLKVKID